MRIRLKEACFVNGHKYGAGEILTLPDGVKGPHRPVRKTHDRIDYGTTPPIDANRIVGEFEDVPLYDELPDLAPERKEELRLLTHVEEREKRDS